MVICLFSWIADAVAGEHFALERTATLPMTGQKLIGTFLPLMFQHVVVNKV
jgi:hypothetical protein